jgi:methyl-accepting chemotaxis protein
MSVTHQQLIGPNSGLPPLSEVSQLIMAQLSQSNGRVAAVVDELRSLTESEVLSCGSILQEIVEGARRMAQESEISLSASTARSEQVNQRFVQQMREEIKAQTAAVETVLDLVKTIEESVTSINDLTVSSRVLAINARIEAARLGEQGRGFAVIADNLAGLSKVIRGSSDKVSAAIASVRQGIVPVSEHADSINQRIKLFVDEIAEQVKLASLHTSSGKDGEAPSNDRLELLQELSNQALSHLQFQDPMSQKLLGINKDLASVSERIRRLLAGEDETALSEPRESSFESEPLSGQILFF